MSDPERWSENPRELTPAERRALAAGRRGPEVPAAAERAVWEGLTATLAVTSATAATGAGATGLTAATLVKQLAIGMLLGAVATGGAAIYGRADHPRPAPSAPASRALPSSAPIPPNGQPATAPPDEPTPTPRRGATLDHGAASARPVPLPSEHDAGAYASGQASFPTQASDGSATAESRRLIAARALLHAGRPSAALSALAAIRADFPAGALAQEREALVIEALLASGDRVAARVRAAAFLEQYPQSPHADSARKALR